MKYEKWEDVPEWLQEAIKEGCNVYDAPFNEYMWIKSQGKDYVVDEKSYTSAVYLYESRTLDDTTPQEWDEAARKALYSVRFPDIPDTITPSDIEAPAKKEVNVGEIWFVKLPSSTSLLKMEVTLVTPCVIGLKILGAYSSGYWVRKEVEFVEEIK